MLLAAGAHAETAPASAGILSPAGLAGGLLRGAIAYGRVVADIRYGGLVIDGQRGGLVLRDLEIAAPGGNENCRISLDRLQITGLSFWAQEETRTHVAASGLSIATNCFGPNALMIGTVTGSDRIPLDSLTLDLRQSSASGALLADIEAISPGIARIEGSADFSYVSMYSPDFFEKLAAGGPGNRFDPGSPPSAPGNEGGAEPQQIGTPTPEFGLRGTLRAAHVSVEDLGVWERLGVFLPPDATRPEATLALLTAEPGTALRELQQDLADSLTAFLAEPGRITAEIRPAAPIAFDTTGMAGPEEAAALFRPTVTNGLPTPPLPLIADPGDQDDPRRLGLALAEGRGLPQNTRRAIELLTPLQQDGEVALTLARLLAESDAATAYGHAQTAASLDAPGAASVLDRIEALLPTGQLLAAQIPADSDPPAGAFASAVALRDAAMALEQGDGVARGYAMAWRLAAPAAGAGDGAAQALLARLEARFGTDPAWIEARDRAADLALNDWTEQDLAARLAGN
ncbi:hypothetical protein IT41_05235 [Paracoccus halophilus]|nr:hypothetical protein IT41_05235 [Paracoccus halophilus]